VSPLPLQEIAAKGLWYKIDYSKLSFTKVNKTLYGRGLSLGNLVGIAAKSGKLDKFPKELYAVEGLTFKNGMGEGALHFAAISGQLRYVPRRFLTEETLVRNQGNKEGTTPLHYAISHGFLEQIPTSLLSPEILELENSHGFSPLDFAIFGLRAYADEMGGPDHLKKSLKQIQFILRRLRTQTLEYYLKKQTKSSYFKEIRDFVQGELHRRKVKSALGDRVRPLDLGVIG